MHLNKFIDQAAYDAGKYDMDFPAVALVGTNIIYNPDPIIDYSKQYLTFEVLSDGSISFGCGQLWAGNIYGKMYYSKDGVNWSSGRFSDAESFSIPVVTGDVVYFKGTNNQYSSLHPDGMGGFAGDAMSFSSTCTYNVSGNIMSLIYGDNFEGQTSFPTGSTSNFAYLFSNSLGNARLISAANLVLPATTLTEYCYYGMFRGCTSLTTAPVLPATTLVNGCYQEMFYGCTNLNSVTCLATSGINDNNCYEWMTDVSTTGTFTKAAGSSWPTGASGIPNGWTVENIHVNQNYLVLSGTPPFERGDSGTVLEYGPGLDISDEFHMPVAFDANVNKINYSQSFINSWEGNVTLDYVIGGNTIYVHPSIAGGNDTYIVDYS